MNYEILLSCLIELISITSRAVLTAILISYFMKNKNPIESIYPIDYCDKCSLMPDIFCEFVDRVTSRDFSFSYKEKRNDPIVKDAQWKDVPYDIKLKFIREFIEGGRFSGFRKEKKND